ncbi:LysR family transcriptional regulator [Yunchengibacter salinarum]|uniref:LysR family transcriptional regulator n=1 Tax=Yunchengibacter salinarum TaxID=3133399 RepID=UPI0035B5E0BA
MTEWRGVNWNDLNFFLAIADEGSISAAARAMKVSQPTLSRRLAALEEVLGCDLFGRARSGLALTETGARLLDHVRHMRDDVNAISRVVTGDNASLTGKVTISAPAAISGRWLADLRGEYPGIRLDLRIDMTAADLVAREADMAIRLFRPDEPDLIARQVGRMGIGFYASRDYLARNGTPQRLADLADHDVALPTADLMGLTNEQVYQGIPVRDRVVLQVNSFPALLDALKGGVGIGPYPCFRADAADDLVRVLPGVRVLEKEMWLAAHGDLRRNARIRAVFDFLRDRMLESADSFTGGPSETVIFPARGGRA